ncbi:TPA: hypothetical protein ACXDAM_002267 [Clostridium botulinum]|nr:hypothetical protein [Clostridium botulinum]
MAKRRIQERGYIEPIEGQLTIWDVQITKKPTKVTKIEEKVTESLDWLMILERYKSKKNLSRIIQYCGGGYGIEVTTTEGVRTIYINRKGKEEFQFNRKSSVLPMDKILFYKKDLQPNKIQEQKLQEIKSKHDVIREIRRKGDENILVELEHKVISIVPKGWVLEFQECKVVYKEDEVIKEVEEVFDIEAMRKSIRVGDWVEATYRNRKITGEICRVYGPDNMTLNIIFDNGRKHTAMSRMGVLKKL